MKYLKSDSTARYYPLKVNYNYRLFICKKPQVWNRKLRNKACTIHALCMCGGDSALSGELQAEFITLYVGDLGERFSSRFGEG